MKPIFSHILISIFATLVLAYMVYALYYFSGNNKQEVCRELEIEMVDGENLKLVSQRDIAIILEQNNLNPIGKSIKNIQTEWIEALLIKNPMIKSVECFITPNAIVRLTVQQRKPKFRVVGFGSYYIDTERKMMPVSPNYAAYVPVVSGKVTVSMAKGKLFDFISFIEQNPFWNAQIEQIFVRDDLKIELVPRVGDAIIVLGTLDDYQKKLEKLHKLYVNGFNVVGWNKYKIIDLQYKNQVVCDKLGIQSVATQNIIQEKKDTIIANKL